MKRQGQLIEALGKRAKELRTSKDPRPKKIEKLRAFLADSKNNMNSIAPLPLPLNAKVTVTGIIAEKCSVFKSNMFPLLVYFRCADETEYPIIFKDGDDMRQDQLVIQLFTLMERLLRKEGLDLRLTAYDVLATAPQQGLAQFIPSKTVAAIMSEHGSLLNYLRANYPDEGSVGTYGVEPAVIDTYIKSCGMYDLLSCPFSTQLPPSWLLCGNLSPRCWRPTPGQLALVTGWPLLPRYETRLTWNFRILIPGLVDFGYILGRDPKVLAPPVKVCKEMVDAMGGTQSVHYGRFKSFCFTAFIILRKSANLILNLLALMVDANIPDVTHRDVHEQVLGKFRLDLTDEDAIKHFDALLNDVSPFAAVLDRMHDWAQYWRS